MGRRADVQWLPEGKRAAVCFTIDDIHPGRSSDAYEAGGDLGAGALGHVAWLLARHDQLRVTLFTTADWREISPVPTRRLLARIPYVRDRVFLTPVHARGTMRLDRHDRFVAYLRSLERTEVAMHGLHHVHTGLRVPVEFQHQDADACTAMLREALGIFRAAALPPPTGMCPPGWNAPPSLIRAMMELGLLYVASARDIRTPITADARASMSGLAGMSLIYPELLYQDPEAKRGRRLVHFTSNFQATSPRTRAFEIAEAGGLIAVKAHIVKTALGFVQVDGLDELYRNYLDALFAELAARYGESLWWTSMGEIAARLQAS